jgi:hypothetical protein
VEVVGSEGKRRGSIAAADDDGAELERFCTIHQFFFSTILTSFALSTVLSYLELDRYYTMSNSANVTVNSPETEALVLSSDPLHVRSSLLRAFRVDI